MNSVSLPSSAHSLPGNSLSSTSVFVSSSASEATLTQVSGNVVASPLHEQFRLHVEQYRFKGDAKLYGENMQHIVEQITPENVDEFATFLLNTPADNDYDMFTDWRLRTRISLLTIFCKVTPYLPSLPLTISMYRHISYWDDGICAVRRFIFMHDSRPNFFRLMGERCDMRAFEEYKDIITDDDRCNILRGLLVSTESLSNMEMVFPAILDSNVAERFKAIIDEHRDTEYRETECYQKQLFIAGTRYLLKCYE